MWIVNGNHMVNLDNLYYIFYDSDRNCTRGYSDYGEHFLGDGDIRPMIADALSRGTKYLEVNSYE